MKYLNSQENYCIIIYNTFILYIHYLIIKNLDILYLNILTYY
jgi:hypothetical protein